MGGKGPRRPPIAVRPVAAAYWRLILQDIHSRWIEATEEPQVGPRFTGTMGSCGARIPEPLSRQIHNRQHLISLALEATYISDELRSAHPLVSWSRGVWIFLGSKGRCAGVPIALSDNREIPHFTGAMLFSIGTRLRLGV